MSIRTITLKEEEIISLIEILDFYRDKVFCYPNNTELLKEVEDLKTKIIKESNKDLINQGK